MYDQHSGAQNLLKIGAWRFRVIDIVPKDKAVEGGSNTGAKNFYVQEWEQNVSLCSQSIGMWSGYIGFFRGYMGDMLG